MEKHCGPTELRLLLYGESAAAGLVMDVMGLTSLGARGHWGSSPRRVAESWPNTVSCNQVVIWIAPHGDPEGQFKTKTGFKRWKDVITIAKLCISEGDM